MKLVLFGSWSERACVESCSSEPAPSHNFLLQLFDCRLNHLFFLLDRVDRPDFVVVVHERQRFGFQLAQLAQQVHRAVFLSDELLVARRAENLGLQRNERNHEAVEALQEEVVPVELEAPVNFALSQVVVDEGLLALVVPDLPETNGPESGGSVDKGQLTDNLPGVVQARIREQVLCDDANHAPLAITRLLLLFLLLFRCL